MKRIALSLLLILIAICGWAHTNDSIDTSNMVVTYDYTCHTTDKNGEKVDDHYSLAVLVGNKITWSTGYLTALKPEKKTRKDLLEELDEQKFNIPSVFVGYPTADEMMIRETMLISDYVTIEKKVPINWDITDDTLTVSSYLCHKATAKVRGREWTVWYTEEVPTTAGPWCLYGCPGLIVKAEADGIHCFELQSLEQKALPIVYTSSPKDMKIKRSKFINYRNKTLVDPAFVSNPLLFVSEMISSMTQLEDNGVIRTILDDHSFNTSPNTYQPLDLE